MTTIQLLACIGMITGFFLLLGLKPMEFTNGLFSFLTREKKSIRDEIKAAQRRQKPGFLKRQIQMAQEVLAMTGRSNRFSLVCACSLLLFAIGAAIAIMMGNFFLAPVMAVGFMMLPFGMYSSPPAISKRTLQPSWKRHSPSSQPHIYAAKISSRLWRKTLII